MTYCCRRLVVEAWPVAQRNAQDASLLENGLLTSVGWSVVRVYVGTAGYDEVVIVSAAPQKTNRAVSQSPPAPTALLSCIDGLVSMLGGSQPPAPTTSYQPQQTNKPGPPMQPQVTAAGVKIFPNAGFNMDDYTTKLDKSALSDEQIRMAERLAREIEGEKKGARRGGWDEGDSGMVSWE